ncbi:uncharacterized protein TNCV_1554421 [Trichonephila clavipes]|nr:uncharacterized protein TNCV_1554421 [Trichonephila clavipes]
MDGDWGRKMGHVLQYCAKMIVAKVRRSSSNGGQTRTISQEGSTVYLVGLERNHLLGVASAWPNTKFRYLLSTTGLFEASDLPEMARIGQPKMCCDLKNGVPKDYGRGKSLDTRFSNFSKRLSGPQRVSFGSSRGKYRRNYNENYNSTVSALAPKSISSGKTVLDAATDIAVCVLNDGFSSILYIRKAVNLEIGLNNYEMCLEIDKQRIKLAERSLSHLAKGAKIASRSSRKEMKEQGDNLESQLYGAVIAD